MATYNKFITIAKTYYDLKNRNDEIKKAVENKEINQMSAEEFDKYLSLLTRETQYVEKSNNIIKNVSSNKWKKSTAKSSYKDVNQKINKLNELGFYDIISGKSSNSKEMINKVLKFNSLNNEVFLSEQKGGVINESIRSFKESYNYFNNLKKEAVEKKESRSFFAFDLETTGGKNLNGIWQPDSITEFSLQEFDIVSGKQIKNHTMIVGLTKDEGDKISKEIKAAIADGTIHTNERLKISAMRYSLYGEKETTHKIDKDTKLWKIDKFADADNYEMLNIEKIERGIDLHVKAGKYYSKTENLVNGIRMDHYHMGAALKDMNSKLENNFSSLVGQNHIGHDIPIIQNQLLKLHNQYKDVTDMFNIDLDIDPHKTIDLLGGTRAFIEYNNVSALYPGDQMLDAKKVAGQEYMAKIHLAKWFEKEGIQAHKAEDDVLALANLFIQKSDILQNNSTVIDHIYNGLEKVKTTDTLLDANSHILRAKKRASSYGGKGYINFATDSEGTVYTASNHILGNKDKVSEYIGGATHENFNVGFGANKGAFYEINKIQKIQMSDEIRNTLGDLAPEYSGKNMYHVQMSMAVTDKYKDSRLGDLQQNFFFKNKKELEGFLSSHFDVVADKTKDGIQIRKEHLDKFDIRELQNIQGNARYVDKFGNWQKNQQELYENALDFSANKILTSRAENTFLRNSSYDKINKALTLEDKLLDYFKELNISKDSLSQREINQIMSGRIAAGQSPLPLNNKQVMKAQNIIKETLSHTKKINGTEMDRLLDSTIDNYSSIMDFISKNKTVLTNIKDEIENRIGDYSNDYKQEIFARTYDAVKREVAEHIYMNSENTNPAKAMAMLTDKRLQTNLHEFKNMYEIDFSSLVKDSSIGYVSIEKPESLTNLHRFDISSKSPMYSMIDKATQSVFGKDYRGNITDNHKQLAVEKLFTTLNKEDELLKNTKAFTNFKKTFGYENNKFEKTVNYLNIADTIIAGMQEVKTKDKFAGIKNLQYSFMKSLEGNEGFIAALNSDKVQEKIGSITENIINNTNINIIRGSSLDPKDLDREIGSIVDKSLLHHYIPDADRVKAAIGNDSRKEMLYNKGVKDIREYLIDTIKGFSFIEGTDISIQNDGALLISNGGNSPMILNKLPQMKLDNDSKVLYLQAGGKKLQLNKKVLLSSESSGIKADVGTNISKLNNFSNSRAIKGIVEEKGAEEGLKAMLSKIGFDMRNLGEGPTINNFSGNDIDSNYNVDLSDIKNVLNDLFSKDGKFKYYLDEEYADKDLKETLQKKLAKASLDEKGRLKELSPDITRDIVKDVFHILDNIATHGNVSQDFLDLLNNTLGFTGQEKKVSNYLMAYEGKERPHNSTFGSFDNTQRPPITQSGNAKFLRIKDIENSNSNIIAGNLISTPYAESKTMRNFSGIGRTTTDVMLDTYYANTSALKVLIESNFNDVIAKSKVEFGTEKNAQKVYTFIRDSINTFEQERIMDSRTFEDVYGLQTAATHKLSKGTDIKSILKDLEGEELEKQKKLISNYRGDVKLINDDIFYESSVGLHVSRGEGTIKTKGFANLKSSFSSKVKDGVFNFNYYNSSGVKLRDEEINQIIKQNKDKFMENGKFVDSYKFKTILDSVLEKENIIGQYVIEDMNALGYAKTMTSGAEKGMTDILYATTGKYDQEVRKVFENIGMWDSVKTKVLTEEAIDALVLKDKNDMTHLEKAFSGTKFSTVDDLKIAMKKERHMHSKMLFEYGLGNKAHLLANDNVVGHGNFGAMYQGSLSKAIDLLSKKHENGMEGAVQTIVNMINGEGEFKGTNDFKFMENWDLSKKKVDISHIGVSNVNGKLLINENFLTENNRISNLNSTKFNNLLRAIDDKYLKGDGTDSDDRLVRKNVYMPETKEDGTQTYKAVDEIVGAFYSREIDGKTVILGAQTKENTKVVTDVETQTGVTDEYFTLKKSLTELKKEKIELESAMNSTNDNNIKNRLNKDLLNVKSKINNVQESLSDYDSTVKTMKFGDQELSIINRVAITQSHINQINELIDKGELDLNSINTLSLKGRLIVGEDGKVKGTTDFNLGNILEHDANGRPIVGEGKGYRALDWFTDKIKEQQWYDEIKDVKLEKKYLELDEYKHLEDIYNHFDNKGLAIGIDKAEEVYQTRMAVAARQFNAGSKNDKEINRLIDAGFEKTHINEVTLDLDALSTKNLLIDLGEDFEKDSTYRHIALPGTGKTIVDEEIRKNSHNKFIALKHQYDEYISLKGSGKEEEMRLYNSIKSLSDDIMKNVDGELFNKNGIMHNLSKVELTTPSYRTKLSGFIGSHFDDSLSQTADGFNVNFINSLNSSLTNTATIDGKSIAELERGGQHYDYKFVSKEQFDNMGYFKEEKLKQFGFVDDEAGTAVSKMEDHLRKYGTVDIFDRYPNTRTGSIAPSLVFLGDDSLTQNQSKVSVSLAMKANADYDGDSGSNFLLRYTDKQGREIDGAYYKRVENIAIENLTKEGKDITANSIVDAAAATGMIEKEDFENFSKLQGQMTTASITDNLKWAEKGKKIIAKDSIKNIKIGDLTNASLVEDGYSDFLSSNVFSRLSQMPTLDDFYETENSANQIIEQAQKLNKEHNISADLLKTGSEKEIESWSKFSEIKEVRLTNSSDSMDKALAILESAKSKKLIDEDYLESAKTVAVKRIGHDKYVQEMMAKTGLAATGNVNLALNSIKLATQFTEEDPSKTMFTNFIWEGLDVAEQGIISDKKRTVPGYDDKRIEGFTQSINSIFKEKNFDVGKKQLEAWMNENGGDVFEVAYDEMGKYILGSKQYNSLSKEDGIKSVKNAFLNHVTEKAQDDRFLSIMATLDVVGRNGNHDKNLYDAIPASLNENFLKANSMEAANLVNENRSKAIMKQAADKALLQNQHAINQVDYEEGLAKTAKEMAKTTSSEAISNVMKHTPKIPMSGGGLGVAMLGTAFGLLVSGYASGNPLQDKSAEKVAEGQMQPPKQTMSVPQFMDQGGMVTGNSQGGYVINLQADTKKGKKYMKRMMAQAAEASVGGAVSVNMNLRDVSQNGVTDKDIESYMNRYL